MKIKKRNAIFTLIFFVSVILAYVLWLSWHPVKIVAVHKENHFSDVLVESFPFTDKGKIEWWLKNKDMLKDKYGIPQPEPDGTFTIVFWLFGDGYKETDGYDRLCFNDMKTKINCIDKERVFSVSYSKNRGTSFIAHDGIYRIKKSGELVKDNIN